ncbi:MAG: glycosyltransferase [Anaerolineales bacterium]
MRTVAAHVARPLKAGLVSVMMPAYNAAAFIGQAIDSVFDQTLEDWELIIIDDGSTDATSEVVGKYSDRRIRLFRQPNQGEASARNAALSKIQGEYLAFLDADDRFLPPHLEITRQYLKDYAGIQAVYTDGYYISQENIRTARLSGHRRGPFQGDLFEPLVRASDVFGPPTCVVTKARPVLEHQLTFDPKIVIGPDWDFFRQLSEIVVFGYLDRPTCEYRVHLSNISLVTGDRERRSSLARCRQKAILSPRFSDCSSKTRTYAFYDLLINLVSDQPGEQEALTQQPAFNGLPANQRARLYRLMASEAIVARELRAPINQWLNLAAALDPASMRNQILRALHTMTPRITRWTLMVRRAGKRRNSQSPFAAVS